MKRKCLAFGIILLFVATGIIPSIAHNMEKPSLPTSSGNWLYVGGNGPGNYTSIQAAINVTSNGDTVFVYDDSSPYKENVAVNKTISLLGENRNSTIIDGHENGCVITLLVDNIRVSNFTIQNAGFNGNEDLAGILIYSSSNLISENIITSDTENGNGYGIITINSSGNTIASNVIQNNYHGGIELRGGNNNFITHNLIFNNTHGSIQIGWSSNNVISENTMIDYCCLGLLESFTNVIIKNNFIIHGIALLLTNSGNNTIKQNNFIKEWERIIFFYNILCASNKGNPKNYWDGNYWYRQRILPKLIFNLIKIDDKRGGIHIEVDRHPAQEPYNITEMT